MIDNTQLTTFQACPEKYRLRFVEQIKRIPDGPESLAYMFGQGLHAGLASYYSYKPLNVANMVSAFKQSYKVSVPSGEQLYRVENATKLLSRYPAYAAANEQEWKVLDVERMLEIELDGVSFVVKPDLIVETPAGIYSVDHKSTQKKLGELYWRSFEPNSQVSAQVVAVKRVYGQCAGTIINVLQMGFSKKAELFEEGNSDSEKYADQEIRYSKYYGKEMVYASGFWCSFQRQEFNRSVEQLEDWKRNQLLWIERVAQSTKTGLYGKNEQQCGWCEYRDLCVSCGDQQVRDSLYEPYEALEYLKPEGVE